MRKLRILTWHVHGNYLYSLTHLPHDFIIPVFNDNRSGYSDLGKKIPWGTNVRMVAAETLCREDFDCIIYQSRQVYEQDRLTLLTETQQKLPCAYIEHNPPEPHPTNTRHFFQEERGILVHVTQYNALMWDSGNTPVAVIEHGVPEPPEVEYSGELERGIVVINNLSSRGRRVGADIYEWASQAMPVDLIGMGSNDVPGGQGEISNMDVPAYIARYRFFFTPIRYASLGLSLVQAMMVGMPIVGIAATELPFVIQNGINGYVDNRPSELRDVCNKLLKDPGLAMKWGQAAQNTARSRFGIGRFVDDWQYVLQELKRINHVRDE
ncbi:glycosyltransferase [Advenella kashmirensis]|nr:glycosyltransferase [Advenella kashmirensis]